MAITYNKQIVKKDRSIQSRGPRDHQKAQKSNELVSNNLIAELKEQVALLTQEQTNGRKSGFTNEQLDEEIIKAVKAETRELDSVITELKSKIKYIEEEHIKECESLKQTYDREVESLRILLKDKDDFIAQLKQTKIVTNDGKENNNFDDIDPVFVDPIEEDFTPLEEHVNVDTDLIITKKDIDNKVGKLKKLLGKS